MTMSSRQSHRKWLSKSSGHRTIALIPQESAGNDYAKAWPLVEATSGREEDKVLGCAR